MMERWEYFGEDWKGEDYGDQSKLGADTRQWFAHSVLGLLTGRTNTDEKKQPLVDKCRAAIKKRVPGEEHAVTAALAAMIDKYIVWVPYSAYRGDGAMGEWRVRWHAVSSDIDRLCHDVRTSKLREADAERCRTLDDWLRADIAGTLQYPGAESGVLLIPADIESEIMARRRLERVARRRKRVGTQATCICGTKFTVDRANATTCPRCRANRRKVGERRSPS